jgi:hypothetical protein
LFCFFHRELVKPDLFFLHVFSRPCWGVEQLSALLSLYHYARVGMGRNQRLRNILFSLVHFMLLFCAGR